MIVSPSMSLVAAGVASGICFILFSSIRKGKPSEPQNKKDRIPLDDSRCGCCLKPFLITRGVQCDDCGVRSCRKGCSRWDTSTNAWHCLFCHQQRSWLKRNEKWFDTFGGPIDEEELHRFFSTAKSRVYVAGVENAGAGTSADLSAENREEAYAMETVRDLIEKIVEGLVGNVDDTPIDRLYDHPEYDKLLAKYTVPMAGVLARLTVSLQLSLANKPSADSPTMAHAALREIVARAVEESRKLPDLAASGDAGRTQEGRSIAEHSYEDLLATAILNKVIEKFQKEEVDGNSNFLHETQSSRNECENEVGLKEGVEEGSSSLERLSQEECSSNCSASCLRHSVHQPQALSLTIEERIEEVTTTYTSDDEHRDSDVLALRSAHRVPFPELGMDIIDPSQESSEDSQDEPNTPTSHVDLVSPIESWEENWLFQKKRVHSQPDPVAMLVPNSNTDFKALIGDKDAEDTSDLSECSSAHSDEEIEKELIEAISNVVPRSPKEPEESWKFVDSSHMNGRRDEVKTKSSEDNGRLDYNEEIEERREFEDICEKSVAQEQVNKTVGDDLEFGESCKKNVEKGEVNKTADVKVESLSKQDEKLVKSGSILEETRDVKKSCSLKNDGGGLEAKEMKEEAVIGEEGQETIAESIDVVDSAILKSQEVANSEDSATNFLSQENILLEIPKTPACTPTRTSLTERGFEISNGLISSEKTVLNSLERAKKKLMVADEEIGNGKLDEFVNDKMDLQAEDIQQESEYTEHYDIATQRHMDSLKTETPHEKEAINDKSQQESQISSKTLESKCREAVAFAKAESASYQCQTDKRTDEETQLATPPRPGTIAEREHKKWENAAPIQNNPYSEESIQKRLWERQYSRRASDIPGMHAELPKPNTTELEVVLGPKAPDIARFGRDYYINHSKSASGDRLRRSTASTSSRPSSSLSQRSSSTGPDHEHQEEIRYKDSESPSDRNIDVKTKVAKWQRNNVEANSYQSAIVRGADSSTASQTNNTENNGSKYQRTNEVSRTGRKVWDDQRVEELLETERKNSKNEINAKLNNQDSNYEAMLEGRKSYPDENQRKIRRIDLKAYGFENEFFSSNKKATRSSSQRVVNKLDLKSFGYDGGLRRTQSNNHLESIVNEEEFRPSVLRLSNKSNLSRCRGYERVNDTEGRRGSSGDNNMADSTKEALCKLQRDPTMRYGAFGSLTAAKSVPNISKCEYYPAAGKEDESCDALTLKNSYDREVNGRTKLENGGPNCVSKSGEYDGGRNGDAGLNGHAVDSVENESNEGDQVDEAVDLNEGERLKAMKNSGECDNNKLPMPSVRRLAEAFSKPPEILPVPAPRATKANGVLKERSSTPEVHIIESPRQMHSLTARSLSKKFREELRQIPNKVTSPPASHVVMERTKLAENQTEVVQSNGENASNDVNVISPGKLKSNIIFWEQMQKRS